MKEPINLPFSWKKPSPVMQCLKWGKRPFALIFSGILALGFTMNAGVNFVSIIFFALFWVCISGALELILTSFLYMIDPMIPDLPAGQGSAKLKIVRSELGEKYIQAFGGRDYHILKLNETPPFNYRIDILSSNFGAGLRDIGLATVKFEQIKSERIRIPWFSAPYTKVRLTVLWPVYHYEIQSIDLAK